MRFIPLIGLLAVCTTAWAAEPDVAPATKPATTRPVPVIAIWHEGGMPLPGTPHEDWRRLVIGIWSDGTIVWSGAGDGAGRPYQTTRLEPAAVEKLVRDLDELKFFTDAEVNHHRNRFPPDAGHLVIAAEAGPVKQQRLSLWRDPPADRFGEVWTAARKLIEQLKPEKQGEPVEQLDESVFRLGRNVR